MKINLKICACMCILMLITAVLGGCAMPFRHAAAFRIVNPKTLHMTDPVGIDSTPVFSWQMESEQAGIEQESCRILVYTDAGCTGRDLLWDSGVCRTSLSAAFAYAGPSLQPSTRYYYRIQVINTSGQKAVSDPAFFETGLLQEGFGSADWISADRETVTAAEPVSVTSDDTSHDFSIEADLRCHGAAAGITFGAVQSIYDEQYVCAADNSGEHPILTFFRIRNFQIYPQKTITLSDGALDENRWHHLRITVSGTEETAELDGTASGTVAMEQPAVHGRIGLYRSRTVNPVDFDNLVLQDADGKPLLREDFSKASRTVFSPSFVPVREEYAIPRAGITLAGGSESPAPMLRKDFSVGKKIHTARLYASALGIAEIYINGQRITDNYFEPGISDYGKSVYYTTYDVTDRLQSGSNTLGVLLGHGWYDRAAGSVGNWHNWGGQLAFRGRLLLTYEDGSTETLDSDSSWLCRTDGPVRNDDMYQGEYYDAEKELPGWSEPDASMDGWHSVLTNQVADDALQADMTARESNPVITEQTLKPVSVTEPADHTYVYDFGRTFSGVCDVRLQEKAGTAVTMRYGEALNETALLNSDDVPGTIWTTDQLSAANTDVYVCKGGDETFSPRLVCRGFRYLQITGTDREIPAEDITARILYSGMDRTGTFSCSDADLNRLYEAVCNSQISNSVGNSSDCPQRDERFGWSGDTQLFAPTAVYNMDEYGFLRSFLQKMRDGQGKDGAFPDMVPYDYSPMGDNGWADGGISITWQLYQQYGDPAIIKENLDAMCSYVDFLISDSTDYIRNSRPDTFGDLTAVNETPKDLVNTAQCVHVTAQLSEMCSAVENEELARKYANISQQYKTAWVKKYLHPDGSIECWTQTAYALALAWDLCPDDLIPAVSANLQTCMEYSKDTIGTGYVGTSVLLPVLRKYGNSDTAYALLKNKAIPSWLSMLDHQGTAVFENWNTVEDKGNDSYTLNGSLTHTALGSVGYFYYNDILGIRPDAAYPGFKKFILAPAVTDRLSWAEGSYESVYGLIRSRWEKTAEKTIFSFTVPANTTAEVTLPAGKSGTFSVSGGPEQAAALQTQGAQITGTLPSGTWVITVPWQ